jgi:adenomatosis polyposis coli protein
MRRDASSSRTVGIVVGATDGMNSAESYDEDASDQPVDYSKEYIERNASAQNRLDDGVSRRTTAARISKKSFDAEHDADKVDPLFGDYAETDLDQPTDYSLRYAEDDTDEEEKQNAEYFHGSEQEDTIKTYCTEGTPYETPFNFSTATSMSDLRLEDGKENVYLMKKLPKKTLASASTSKVPASIFVKQADECAGLDNGLDLVTKEENTKDAAILNPGQVTPEKMVNYYEEEITHGFSPANSLSSLSGAVTPRNNIPGVMSKVDSPVSASKEELRNDDQDQSQSLELPSESNSVENKQAATGDLLDKEGSYQILRVLRANSG